MQLSTHLAERTEQLLVTRTAHLYDSDGEETEFTKELELKASVLQDVLDCVVQHEGD